MLTYNLQRIFKIKFIEHPYAYLYNHGFGKSESYRYAKTLNPNITLDKVEKLCLLFNCTPDDLMEWTPDKPEDDRTDHHLNYLRKTEVSVNFRKLIRDLSPEQILELNKELSKKEYS